MEAQRRQAGGAVDFDPGAGGYASGTLAGVNTRRYHALLVAALPAPLGRTILLNRLAETLVLPGGRRVELGGIERAPGALHAPGLAHLEEFRLELGLPVWRHRAGGVVLERRLVMPHGQNTAFVEYRLLEAPGPVGLRLRPYLHPRGHDGAVSAPLPGPPRVEAAGARIEIHGPAGLPPLRLHLTGDDAALTLDAGREEGLFHRVEAARGYDCEGRLWSPGAFRAALAPGGTACLAASAEPWTTLLALAPEEAFAYEAERRRGLVARAHPALRGGPAAELVIAADQFVFRPASRIADLARAKAAGDDVCSVIAGYHWFTDWGRDTMISLEGLTLATGRHREAGWVLRTFAHYVRDGLIPNFIPEHRNEGVYHTADATLWFFHALDRYLDATGDRATLAALLPTLRGIVEAHLRGTRFNIGMDPADGLLRQGAEGYQLTWMDAKVDGWVVTPRRGKPVEINALWHNALRLMAEWLGEAGDAAEAARLGALAARAAASFNARFWNPATGHLFDVVDGEGGDDPACRPNQLFALALRHPVLDPAHWRAVLDAATERLLTPHGLRSLAPGHPDYKPRYEGDLRARDAAYHQGTVWGWLIGPYVDAWLRVHPEDRAGARAVLERFLPQLDEACIGSLSEVFDAEPPFAPRGCVAQAWSVAEMLRCWAKTAPSA
ncbi:MAG TPA: amylo-alpha-1,6-glucosidase [Alphaproteobacteria bacterium]|nr:amylo-alpha-1,6-glucosidase [Alphaproteobacteria bacterium]